MNTNYHHLKAGSHRGFSINELLVSIAIFSIISTLVIANFSRGKLSDDLRISTQTFAGDLRRMQNLATVGQALSNGQVPPGGYGISIPWTANVTTYTEYADTATMVSGNCQAATTANPNTQYDPGPIPCDQPAEAGTRQLRAGVVIDAIRIGSTTTTFGTGSWDSNSRVDIDFQPPRPAPVIDGVSNVSLYLQLRQVKTNEMRTISIIGATGQVSERLGGIP